MRVGIEVVVGASFIIGIDKGRFGFAHGLVVEVGALGSIGILDNLIGVLEPKVVVHVVVVARALILVVVAVLSATHQDEPFFVQSLLRCCMESATVTVIAKIRVLLWVLG